MSRRRTESQLFHSKLDKHVRDRIREMRREDVDCFSGQLNIKDILPHFKNIMPATAWEPLECAADRDGNAYSIHRLMDMVQRYSRFGIALLRAIEKYHHALARSIIEGLDVSQLPSSSDKGFLLKLMDNLYQGDARPPSYNDVLGDIHADQEKEWNSSSRIVQDEEDSISANGFSPVAQSIDSHLLPTASNVCSHGSSQEPQTLLPDRYSAMRMNIEPSVGTRDDNYSVANHSRDPCSRSQSGNIGIAATLPDLPFPVAEALPSSNVENIQHPAGDKEISTEAEPGSATIIDGTGVFFNRILGKAQNPISPAIQESDNENKTVAGELMAVGDIPSSEVCISDIERSDELNITVIHNSASETVPKEIGSPLISAAAKSSVEMDRGKANDADHTVHQNNLSETVPKQIYAPSSTKSKNTNQINSCETGKNLEYIAQNSGRDEDNEASDCNMRISDDFERSSSPLLAQKDHSLDAQVAEENVIQEEANDDQNMSKKQQVEGIDQACNFIVVVLAIACVFLSIYYK